MCNIVKNGMPESFEEHLRDDYGDEEVDALLKRGREIKQFSNNEYKELVHKYRRLIKEKGVIV